MLKNGLQWSFFSALDGPKNGAMIKNFINVFDGIRRISEENSSLRAVKRSVLVSYVVARVAARGVGA